MPAALRRRSLPALIRALPAPVCALLAVILAAATPTSARAEPAWTTYHRDAGRSGADPETLTPTTPSLAWQSPELGAPIWGQPLVLGTRVYVATVGDDLYALEASTGQVVWRKSLGTPVPANALPCGDIEPTVGVVGTPVIDPAAGVVYAVADTWDATQKEAHHVLKGVSLASGEEVLSVPVDPPGFAATALLQRAALNIDGGRVIFGFGGNDGDCADYRGTVVAVPETGGSPLFWQVPIAPPAHTGGAVWGASGPAVDGSGTIYASTGNPNPEGAPAETFDYSDGLVALDPAHDLVADPAHEAHAPLGYFEPPSWMQDSNNDTDLGSAGPELLPGGVVFQAGKNGTGYLIDTATMSSGAPALYSGKVCGGSGSFGGDAYAGGVIYIACTSGVQALSYSGSARTFTPLWQGPKDAFGPPIVSGGLVWSVATGGFSGGGTKLYGLDPATGHPTYTERLPSPVADHFASPSAGGGRVLVATGASVSAFAIGFPLASSQTPSAGAPGSTPIPPVTARPPGAGTAATSRGLARLVHRRLHLSRRATVRVTLRCPRAARCRGTLLLLLKMRQLRRTGTRGRVAEITLARRRFGPVRGEFRVELRLGRATRALLAHRSGRLVVQVVIEGPAHTASRTTATLSE